jgi:hypothetical protein
MNRMNPEGTFIAKGQRGGFKKQPSQQRRQQLKGHTERTTGRQRQFCKIETRGLQHHYSLQTGRREEGSLTPGEEPAGWKRHRGNEEATDTKKGEPPKATKNRKKEETTDGDPVLHNASTFSSISLLFTYVLSFRSSVWHSIRRATPAHYVTSPR